MTRFLHSAFKRVKVIALAVNDLERANRFYGHQLGLSPAFEGAEQVGWWLGQIILMLKPDWAVPTDMPNPRVTWPPTMRRRPRRPCAPVGSSSPTKSSPTAIFYVGSFLDSEGNKLWFCSPVEV